MQSLPIIHWYIILQAKVVYPSLTVFVLGTGKWNHLQFRPR